MIIARVHALILVTAPTAALRARSAVAILVGNYALLHASELLSAKVIKAAARAAIATITACDMVLTRWDACAANLSG